MIFEILLDSFTLFEKESARPDEGEMATRGKRATAPL